MDADYCCELLAGLMHLELLFSFWKFMQDAGLLLVNYAGYLKSGFFYQLLLIALPNEQGLIMLIDDLEEIIRICIVSLNLF